MHKKHANSYLQNAYNKYGAASFIVTILEECAPDSVLEREQFYINKLNPIYNLTRDVIDNRLSLKSRQKLSETMKEKVRQGIITYPLNKDKEKKVIVYDSKCDCIGEFSSQNAAGRFLQSIYPMFNYKTVSTIISSKKNKRNRYKDYFLLYPGEKCQKDVIRTDAFKIECYDVLTNTSKIYLKSADVAKNIKCSDTSIYYSLKHNKVLRKRYILKKL
jgi:group I intron endonuclease